MSLWEPFTEGSRRSIALAQEESQRLGYAYIGTEHILLGIISEGESPAAKVLETLGVNLAKVRSEVEVIVGRGGTTVHREMTFTPRAKRVIEFAFEEARSLNHNYISPAHLLLGIIREGESVGARVLMNLGVRAAQVRAQTAALLESHPPEEASRQRPRVTELRSTVGVKSSYLAQSPEALLTSSAQHALIAATEAAQRHGSPVCTEAHLVYGIAHVEASKASRALAEVGVTSDLTDSRLRPTRTHDVIDPDEIAVSASVRKNVLSRAFVEAQSSGRRKANVEHLLLAIVEGEDNDGSALLKALGVDVASLGRALREYLEGNG